MQMNATKYHDHLLKTHVGHHVTIHFTVSASTPYYSVCYYICIVISASYVKYFINYADIFIIH